MHWAATAQEPPGSIIWTRLAAASPNSTRPMIWRVRRICYYSQATIFSCHELRGGHSNGTFDQMKGSFTWMNGPIRLRQGGRY